MELNQLVEGFKTVEQEVASIYRMFMEFFPEEKTFWQDLYMDELEHAYWLSNASHIESIDLLPSKDLIPTEELLVTTLKFIEGERILIKSGPVSLDTALKVALKLEGLMIEVFTNELTANLYAFDYDSLSKRIGIAERLHINKIEEMMIEKGFLHLS